MGHCFSKIHPQCLWCDKSIHKNGPTILYSFQGCGKYHNKTICNICLKNNFGLEIDNESYEIPNDINKDPLGMTILIKKKI